MNQIELSTTEDVTNIQVGKKLEELFYGLLSVGAKALICKILPNDHKLIVMGFTTFKLKDDEAITVVGMNLKDELKERWAEHYAFMLAETINDIWNKYMADEFFLVLGEDDKFHFEIGWNQFMPKEELHKYWFSNRSNGYKEDAPFWTREWLREEHRIPTTGGGKI